MTIIKITNVLKVISDKINKVAIWLSTIYLGAVTILVFAGVVTRFMGNSLSWSEELARWFLIGTCFIASSVAIKSGAHVGVTIIVKSLPEILKKAFIILSDIIVMISLFYMFYCGFQSAMAATNMSGDIVNLSMVYVKMHIPIGAAIMIIHLLYFLCELIQTDDPENFLISRPTSL